MIKALTSVSQHCGKPVCCPSNAAPKSCMWRGDNNGQGSASDCSGQCLAGETNIAGIRSSWGGGFTNDGNTNKCGRGFKTFCCPDPEFDQVTAGCTWTGWYVKPEFVIKIPSLRSDHTTAESPARLEQKFCSREGRASLRKSRIVARRLLL